MDALGNAIVALVLCAVVLEGAILGGIAVGIVAAVLSVRRTRRPEFGDGLLGGGAGGTIGAIVGKLACTRWIGTEPPGDTAALGHLVAPVVGLAEGMLLGSAVGFVFAWRSAARGRQVGVRSPAV